MLKDFPVKINGTAIFPANAWEESSEVIESTYDTEAGTTQLEVTRYDRLSVSAAYRCHSGWLKTFKQWSAEDSLSVELYDAETSGYKTRSMRMRDFKSALLEFSEGVKDTNGVWDVSFSLEEF